MPSIHHLSSDAGSINTFTHAQTKMKSYFTVLGSYSTVKGKCNRLKDQGPAQEVDSLC